jgi:hypothetical protein
MKGRLCLVLNLAWLLAPSGLIPMTTALRS